ncbi:hypothetical protein BDR07DRAFT_1613355 [Suillus spraguei]|nr:hypothetical protein BDR07DRAFT_1613355 [Suillus spraguei]
MPNSNVQTSYGSTTSIPVSISSPSPSHSPVNNSSNSRAIVGGVISEGETSSVATLNPIVSFPTTQGEESSPKSISTEKASSPSTMPVVAVCANMEKIPSYPQPPLLARGTPLKPSYAQARVSIPMADRTCIPPTATRRRKKKAASGRQGLDLAVHHPDGAQVYSTEGGESRDVPPVYDSIWP